MLSQNGAGALRQYKRQRRQEAAGIIDAIETAVRKEEPCALMSALRRAGEADIGARALRRIISLNADPTISFRLGWLEEHQQDGDELRYALGEHDLLMLSASRKLLPPYAGKSRMLYRGEMRMNRKRRTYGMCWTDDVEIARGFATGTENTSLGIDKVLIEAHVPPIGIICAPALINGDPMGEREFIVDRRYLRGVKVIASFPGSTAV